MWICRSGYRYILEQNDNNVGLKTDPGTRDSSTLPVDYSMDKQNG